MALSLILGSMAALALGAPDTIRVASATTTSPDRTPSAASAPATMAAPAGPVALPILIPLPAVEPGSIDTVLIEKGRRRLTLFSRGESVRSYLVALGFAPVGDKERQGDGRTPEGQFFIEGRNPQSRFHLSLRISYPTPEDVARARALGVSPGGDIMIHGLPNGKGAVGRAHRQRDWTEGCVAVTNEEIEEMWRLVPDGAVVIIRP